MKKFYLEGNDDLQAYDIMKRNSVIDSNNASLLKPERICTIYSMDYLDAILEALEQEDAKEDEGGL